jgi:hypothetical protein
MLNYSSYQRGYFDNGGVAGGSRWKLGLAGLSGFRRFMLAVP